MKVVHKSNDYTQFSFFYGNRKIKQFKVKQLAESIKKYGLMNPLLVNQKNQILDGQHRFESCKLLNVPIEYVVQSVDLNKQVEVVKDINSVQTNWGNVDIAEAFSIYSHNKEDYQRYLDLKALGVSHSTIVECTAYLSKGEEKIRTSLYKFKDGDLIISQTVFDRVKGQILMLKNSSINPKIWNRIYFIRALLKLRQRDDFDVYKFIENFNKFPHEWKNAYTVDQNLISIRDVHNYRNRDKCKFRLE